jgi:Bifunctional DNA primase/polymerase, N-terminal/AAA domain
MQRNHAHIKEENWRTIMSRNSGRPASQQGDHPENNQGHGSTLDAALGYQADGQFPIPTCWSDPCAVAWHLVDKKTGEAKPCDSPGKTPLVKFKDRTTVTAEEIRRWLRRWPLANLAMLTGRASGLVVVDVDGPDGEAQLRRLEALYGPLPATMEVKTRNGRHLYFKAPDVDILTRRGGMFWPEGKDQPNAQGVDVRGRNGYVVGPPSPDRVLANELEPAELPESWITALSTGSSAAALPAEELSEALAQIRTEGEPCDHIEKVLEKYQAHEGGRHGAVVAAQRALTAFGREQHPGAGQALDQLRDAFLVDKPDGEHEWTRALNGAVAMAMASEPEQTGCPYRVKELDLGDDMNELLDAYAERRAKEKDKPNHYEDAVKKELERLIVRDAAQRRYLTMQAEQLPEPELTSLTDLLDEPDDDPTWRVDGLWPTGGNIILAAARKAGKTTMVGNLARSLVDGDAFLGVPGPAHVNGFDVTPVDGMVAILDLELDRRMLRRWLRDQNIGKRDQVMAESFRGRAHLLDVLDDKRRGKWAELLAGYGVQVVILDPLGALLDAYGRDENSNTEVGPVLQALDALKAEAGVQELLLAHHMGHNGERSRGASKLRGWPDAEWFLVREKAAAGEEPPPDAARFFLAEGRDVMVPEAQISYDPATRRLTVAGGNRVQHKATKNGPALLQIIEQTPGMSVREIREAAMARGIAKHPAEEALHKLIRDGLVRTEPGPKRATLHYPVSGPVARALKGGPLATPPAAGQSNDQDPAAGPLDPFAQDHVTEMKRA